MQERGPEGARDAKPPTRLLLYRPACVELSDPSCGRRASVFPTLEVVQRGCRHADVRRHFTERQPGMLPIPLKRLRGRLLQPGQKSFHRFDLVYLDKRLSR